MLIVKLKPRSSHLKDSSKKKRKIFNLFSNSKPKNRTQVVFLNLKRKISFHHQMILIKNLSWSSKSTSDKCKRFRIWNSKLYKKIMIFKTSKFKCLFKERHIKIFSKLLSKKKSKTNSLLIKLSKSSRKKSNKLERFMKKDSKKTLNIMNSF